VVHLWNTEKYLKALDTPPTEALPSTLTPLFTFKGHTTEGFAMDWSPKVEGRLLTGDNKGYIYCWDTKDKGASWNVDQTPFLGHKSSVEDLQWSPQEPTVFASSSADGTIKIWDTRTSHNPMLNVKAHDSDVNVISWNRVTTYLLASGSDDQHIKVWDLRHFKSTTVSPVANYKFHKGAITSVEWHPTDETVLAASSEDDSISIWDMSLEADTEVDTPEKDKKLIDKENENVPAQLLFLHQGQKKIKEIHFHPQVPSLLISTSFDGFDVFKASNM